MALSDHSSLYLSPHRHKNRYYNYHNEKFHAVFFNSLSMFFRSFYYRTQRKKPTQQDWVVPSKQTFLDIPTVTWVGHSTFLIHLNGITIVTDPIFGHASLLFKRIFPPGIALNDLVSLNYILLSHNHRDHMDAHSLLSLRDHNPKVLVPEGDKKWFLKRKFAFVEEKTWWESSTFYHNGKPLTITFLPAHHWSQRSLFDRNKSLWGSWMIEYDGFTLYFAGDTAYASHFSKIKTAFPSINVALIPIGPCEPRKWMKAAHLGAEQAGQAFLDLGAQRFIPMHWGTFYFGTDSYSYPLDQLTTWWKNQTLVTIDQLNVLKIGEQWRYDKSSIVEQQSVEIQTIF